MIVRGEAPTIPGVNGETGANIVTLADGTRVPVRPIYPSDAAPLQAFHRRLSEQSIYLRFFAMLPALVDERARYFADVDGVDRVALVALDPAAPDTIIAVVRYDRLPGTDQAEYAAVVTDRWQGRGIGAALSRQLIEIARHRGICQFVAIVLPENARMLHLFRDLGLPEHTRWDAGTVRVVIDLISHDEPATTVNA